MALRNVLSLVLLASLMTAAGCGTKIKVNQYPQFYSESLRAIAVVPFRSAAKDPNAGTVISENLARAMMQNNTYRVFSHNDLAALMDQQDLMVYASSGDATAAASKLKPGGKVQAMLVGTVTLYDHTSSTQQRQDPQYTYDDKGRQQFAGYRTYAYTRNEATVAVSAALIRVSDGTQIHATAEAVGRDNCQGEVPARDRFECLRRATAAAVNKMVEEFAVTIKEVGVGSKNFRPAIENYDNQWKWADRFSEQDEKMYLVLTLPPSCDRNVFRIVIVRQDQREELASVEINYERNWADGGKGFEFSPKDLASKHGPGSYQAKLYHGKTPVIVQKFKIETPR